MIIVKYVIGNSYIATLNAGLGFPNPFYNIAGDTTQYLGYEIDLEDTGNPVWLSNFSDGVSLNVVIFEPIYYSGGRLDVDKFKRKPRKFSLQGLIDNNDIKTVEKYRMFLEALLTAPEDRGGIDPTLSKMQGVEVPAFYIRKVFVNIENNNQTVVKTQELRAICEEINFEPDQQRKFRRLNFNATLTALDPVWREI